MEMFSSKHSSNSRRRVSSRDSNSDLSDDQEYKPSSFRSFQSSSSSESNEFTMAIPKANSPSKSCRSRKVAMVIKKQQPSPKMASTIAELEGELKHFLSKETIRSAVLPIKSVDDCTTSTASRTTKSSSNNKEILLENNKIEESSRSHKTNTTAATSTSRDNSLKESDLPHWDWSHHSHDWMNIQSSSQHGFEQGFAEFPDMAEDEHVHTLNDSIHELHGSYQPLTASQHDLALSPVPRKPRSSRRIQRQQEFQHALNQSFNNGDTRRRLGEETPKRPGSARQRRSTFKSDTYDDFVTAPPIADSLPSQHRRSGTSSRRGARTADRKSRDQSRDRSLDRVRSNSRDHSRDNPRDVPRSNSRDRIRNKCKSREMSRSTSRDYSRSTSRDKTKDRSGHQRSRSPLTPQQARRRPRRMSGSHQTPRSRSSDPYREEPIPFSSASRRGRRRSSMGNNAPAAIVQEQHPRAERGRRRSSMSHVTQEKEHRRKQQQQQPEQQTRRRGSSLTSRIARQRSLDNSYHSLTNIGPTDVNETPNRRRRRRSRSITNKERPRSKSTERSARSPRAEALLPQRLSKLLGRGSNNETKLQKLALAILVAEGDNDLDHAALEKVPTHLLDPSKVPLNIQW